MKAEWFLQLASDRELVSDRQVAKLRAQLGSKLETTSARSLAKLLVKNGLLTTEQAKRLLATDPGDEVLEVREVREVEPTPADDDDPSGSRLDLVPIEEDEQDYPFVKAKRPAARPRSPDPQPAAQEDHVVLEPTDDSGPDGSAAETLDLTPAADAVPPPAAPPPVSPPPLVDTELLDDPSLASAGGSLLPAKRGLFRWRNRSKALQRPVHDPNRSEWESPLILVGGGTLLLLTLVGVIVWYLLRGDTAAAMLASANEQYENGSYTQAIDSYERFLESFPDDRLASEARVQLGVARMRKVTEGTSNFARALDVVGSEVSGIEDEEKFFEAHGELAALLERIVRGLADQADTAKDAETISARVSQTEQALKLLGNTKYVPKSQRPVEVMDEVRQVLALVEQRQVRQSARGEALDAIVKATEAGDVRSAYATYRGLLEAYPQFARDPLVKEAVGKIGAAEQSRIEFVDQPRTAEPEDGASPVLASLALADRSGDVASGDVRPIFFRIHGAVFALDAQSGSLLWRRYVGYNPAAMPLVFSGDVFVVDATSRSLLRLEGKTGGTVWRLPIGDESLTPVLWQERILLASRSGKLWSVDVQTGGSPGYIQFAQAFPVPPLVNEKNGHVVLVGEHSSVYVLVGEKLLCKQVFHLGHRAGAIAVPPVSVLNHIAIAENFGEQSSRLHLLTVQADGRLVERAKPIRLAGHVTSLPVVAGRRLVVLTDRGEIRVFDVAPGQSADVLSEVAVRAATGGSAQRFGLLHNGRLWAASTRLSRFRILPAGNRLQSEELIQSFDGDAFDQPLLADGEQIVHMRRRADAPGATVAAVDSGDGRIVWQTQLAAPPAGEPIVDARRREIVAANRAGSVFLLDENSIRAGVQSTSLSSSTGRDAMPLVSGIVVDEETCVFGPAGERKEILALRPQPPGSDDRQLVPIPIPDAVACPPAAFAGGVLCPTRIGQVFLLDPATGDELATPFQPRLTVQQPVAWTRPSVSADGSRFAIADRNGSVYVVQLVGGAPAQMKVTASTDALPAAIATPAAFVGNTVLVGTQDNRLRAFALPDMDAGEAMALNASITWGPHAAGEFALVATEVGEVVCVHSEGRAAWRKSFGDRPPVGRPLVDGESVLFALPGGTLVSISLADGKALEQIDVGEPLAAGPVRFGRNLILTTSDGTLLVVDRPE